MGRRRLALELIPNEKARRSSYEKRKKGMMKKAQELTTVWRRRVHDHLWLGVSNGWIGSGSATATKPEIWPVSPEKGADRRAKRTVVLPEFFASRKRKVDAELAEARMANHEAKYPISEAQIEGLSEEDLKGLLSSMGHKLEVAEARLVVMKGDAMRRSSHMYDHQVHANDHIYDHHQMQGLFQNPYLFSDVLPERNFHFTTPEGMMLSETACYDVLMVQPAPAPCAALRQCQEGSVPDPNDAGFFTRGFSV
ncbi:hypothetical protein BT93_H2011 [Corymbia citriodora subsp. variegata]|nr:hypothetical protein BT93_H2011 [Corymbia citriodora subsp. variegata]